MKEHEGAVQSDPLNLQLRSIFSLALMIAGRGAAAADECRRILELDENYHLGHFYLSFACLQQGQIEKALASAEKAHSLAPWARAGTGSFAGLLKLAGDTTRAETVLETLGDGTAPGSPIGFMHYHLIGSEIEQAVGWAEKAVEQREPAIIYFLLHPLAKPLRQSARWPAVAKMMNLPVTLWS